MARASTWSNPDGLVVGFGRNISSYNDAAAVTKHEGEHKIARLDIDYRSTSGASGAKVSIPAGSVVRHVWAKVVTTWVGGTTISFGDAGDVAGWILAASHATPSAGAIIEMDGVYAQGNAATNLTQGKEYAAATDLYITITGTYTAGKSQIFVEYA